MDVLVLGPVEVLREGASVPIGGPKQRSILALLAAHVGSSLSLDQIVESIYGDEATDGARRRLGRSYR